MKTERTGRIQFTKLPGAGIVFIFSLVLFLFPGCSREEGKNTHHHKSTVIISGSGSGINILKILQDPFEKRHPGIKLDFLPSTGTRDGIIGVAQGLLDIGAAAREMKKSEKEKYPDLIELPVLEDAMILAVNKDVDVTSLTSRQIREIHDGTITNWKEVGGQDSDIVVLDREESESSKILLRKHIFGPDMKITGKAVLMHSADSMDQAIEMTSGTIGQTSLGMIKAKQIHIRPVAIDGVIPTVATVRDGTYKLVRKYGIILRKGEIPAAVKVFGDYVCSEEAGKILEEYGFVPASRRAE